MASVIIQKGGAAGGRMECDGKKHLWIYAEHKAYGLPEFIRMGKCPNPAACQQKAAALLLQEKEEAERVAKAVAAMQAKQQQSPATVKKG